MEHILEKFILDNENLINSVKGDFIEKAYNELPKEAFYRLIEISCGIDNPLITKVESDGVKNMELYFWHPYVYFANNPSIKNLDEIKEFLIERNVKVVVDYEGENIKIFFFDKKIDAICENNEQKIWFDEYSNVTLEKAKNGNFKDLIHFIFYHTVKKIKYVNPEEMKRLWSKDEQNIINKYLIDNCLWGFYSDKVVYLCRNLIEGSAKEFQQTYENKLCCKCKNEFTILNNNMFDLLYKKVFTHEFGHLVFEWVETKEREKKEKQANYFSSYVTDGKIDDFISWVTYRQPDVYKNPYLKGNLKVEELYE